MADKLLVILVNTPSDGAVQIEAAIRQAMSAAAMEYDVEVILSGAAGRLAVAGEAAGVPLDSEPRESVYDLLREAEEAGVVFKTTSVVEERANGQLIPEIDEIVGDAYLISESMEAHTLVFTY